MSVNQGTFACKSSIQPSHLLTHTYPSPWRTLRWIVCLRPTSLSHIAPWKTFDLSLCPISIHGNPSGLSSCLRYRPVFVTLVTVGMARWASLGSHTNLHCIARSPGVVFRQLVTSQLVGHRSTSQNWLAPLPHIQVLWPVSSHCLVSWSEEVLHQTLRQNIIGCSQPRLPAGSIH